MARRIAKSGKSRASGNLRIGDQWNAITIIALSQSNPLKAVAELVENSIDARARTIVITRGKDKGQHYLRVKDDGEGVRKNADGEPDFHYVATHVCDSVKRRLKAQGAGGLQGEFGIGLLSFWTLGEDLLLTSAGNDGRAYQMHLSKGDPSYRITHRPALFPEPGTEVLIKGILPGIKNFSGEKIQFDAPYLNLTPGTRQGVIHDAALARLAEELAPLESRLAKIIEDQQRAEEERASRDVLRSVQGALKEALLALPAEEYDWFDLHRGEGKRRPRTLAESTPAEVRSADDQAIAIEALDNQEAAEGQRQFSGDRARRPVEHDLAYAWAILEGEGTLEHTSGEIATFRAAAEPGLARVEVTVAQGDVVCKAEAQITVTASLLPKAGSGNASYQGLPGYTYQKAAGELWRSRFDAERNLVVINNGHRDFVYAARSKMLKLRYICRLFAKELVLRNFIGIPADQLLERLLELTLYTEENLR